MRIISKDPKKSSRIRHQCPEIAQFKHPLDYMTSPIPDESSRVEFSLQDRHQDAITCDNTNKPETSTYAQFETGESATTYSPMVTKMTSNYNTNYIRAVNDYSTSLHELWSRKYASEPKMTSILNLKGLSYQKLDDAILFIMDSLHDKLENVNSYSTDFHDDEDEEPSQYTTYAQRVITANLHHDKAFGIEALGSIESSYFTVFSPDKETASLIIKLIKESKKLFGNPKPPRKEKTFHTISSGRNGFTLEDLKLKSQYEHSIVTENYNDDFEKVDKVIKDAIHDDKKGLILLHGIPGSGKTSYIKHLITSPSDRKIVYVPTHLTSAIASPSFISFVKEELTNSVLVIEDAEQVLLNRENMESQKEAVSNILNMTDGILAEALNLLIICTFNTDMENLDKALLRKGRLLVRYHFDKLSKEKTDTMCLKLYGRTAGKALSLADIYGLDYELIAPEEPKKIKMGFAP